jgi:hypothetical protein
MRAVGLLKQSLEETQQFSQWTDWLGARADQVRFQAQHWLTQLMSMASSQGPNGDVDNSCRSNA